VVDERELAEDAFVMPVLRCQMMIDVVMKVQ